MVRDQRCCSTGEWSRWMQVTRRRRTGSVFHVKNSGAHSRAACAFVLTFSRHTAVATRSASTQTAWPRGDNCGVSKLVLPLRSSGEVCCGGVRSRLIVFKGRSTVKAGAQTCFTVTMFKICKQDDDVVAAQCFWRLGDHRLEGSGGRSGVKSFSRGGASL